MNTLRKPDTTRRRVAAVGMWDGVHRGHRFLIDFVRQRAAATGLTPAVVTFEGHPMLTVCPDRAPRLLTSTSGRLELLDRAGVADCILLDFNERLRSLTAREFLTMLSRDYGVSELVVGFNNRFGSDRTLEMSDYIHIGESLGMTVTPAPEFVAEGSPVSSSRIRALLSEGQPDAASSLLGRPYSLSGIVEKGKQLGRTLGFPTANLRPERPDALIPAPGVYAARAITPDGIARTAMVNIGSRPTVDTPDAPQSIEAHIFNFSGDLYGRPLSLEFLRYLRPERRFPSIEALRHAIEADAAAVLSIPASGN